MLQTQSSADNGLYMFGGLSNGTQYRVIPDDAGGSRTWYAYGTNPGNPITALANNIDWAYDEPPAFAPRFTPQAVPVVRVVQPSVPKVRARPNQRNRSTTTITTPAPVNQKGDSE